ncbi:MAG: HipA domain protein [Chitinophagaceae bacterium]|nr:HipA domain protein [Chitinophagaceae bacterium]
MQEENCLYCCRPLAEDEQDFHARCSRSFFGTNVAPRIETTLKDLAALAAQAINKRITIPGVQAKLSLNIEADPNDPKASRLTIVGVLGHYILKPPPREFPHLPELECVTMELGENFGLDTAAHSLIRLRSGELAYITRRFDRKDNNKLHMEDFCQLSGKLTADKYRSTYEQAGKIIKKYSTKAGFDLISYFEIIVFSFLTGNADMHLKNFSLIRPYGQEINLSTAYDLVPTKLVIPDDEEEMALKLNNKLTNLTLKDFRTLAANLGIQEKVCESILTRFTSRKAGMLATIERSFLGKELKQEYTDMLLERASRLTS